MARIDSHHGLILCLRYLIFTNIKSVQRNRVLRFFIVIKTIRGFKRFLFRREPHHKCAALHIHHFYVHHICIAALLFFQLPTP